MKYQVKLEVYNGPLDLLLRLLEKEEIPARDVSVCSIIEQFLEHFRGTGSNDIEEGGRFLVLAAALLSLKARLLLPQPRRQEGEREYCNEEDDREGLTETSLQDYLLIVKAAAILDERAREWRRSYPRSLNIVREHRGVQEDVSLLVRAFQRVLAERPSPPAAYVVENSACDLEEAIENVKKMAQERPEGLLFRELFTDKSGKEEVIAVFLAVLELVFQGEIKVWQDRETGEIHLLA